MNGAPKRRGRCRLAPGAAEGVQAPARAGAVDVECRANAAYEAYRARGRMKDGRRFGRPPDPYLPPATPAGKINVTDQDSRNVKTPRGWVQGYNVQAADTNGRS